MEIGVLNFDNLKNNTSRKIIHIDMDAFYASIEMRDNPQLKDKPVIMAKHPSLTNGRGIVSTCNYKAREFGIRSAMSAQKALQLCPHAVFIPANIKYYAQVSKQIHDIFKCYTDIIEPLSLDEAYLDVTRNKIGAKSAIYIAKCIQRDIWQQLRLTCSAGVSYNKFLAKIASDYQKPSGLTTITPNDAIRFLKDLPIEKFYGVGVKTVEKLHEMGIVKGSDIWEKNPSDIIEKLGKLGFFLLQHARGIDNSAVKATRQRKSLGRERTYYPELANENDVTIAIRTQSIDIARTLKQKQLKGNVVSLKIRYTDFETISRQRKLEHYIDEEHMIYQEAMTLWEEYGDFSKNIRLMGVSVSGLEKNINEEVRLEL